jgi:hypothetical protein
MRSVRFVSLLVLISLARSAAAQQATASQAPVSAAQATALLQQALAALSGGHPINDVTLSGIARRIAGSDDESGTVVVKALAATGTRLDLTLPSGTRSEIRNTTGAPIVGSWSGPDGIVHPIVDFNLVMDPCWFPAHALASFAASPNSTLTNLGPETKNGDAVIHIAASFQFPEYNAKGAAFLNHLSETQIYLDATTFLPVSIYFNIHPDGNSLIDIPIELDYSNYQLVNGAQIPFHVQRFINNTLVLDLQFNSAVLNSGLSASTFAVGAGL